MENMSRRYLAPLILAACLGGLLAICATASALAPTITAITPNHGPEAGASSVTITGTGFIAGSTVKFGTASATGVSIASEKSITATSPAGKGTVGVSVTNTNGTSAATPYDQFAYDPSPTASWLGLNGNSTIGYLGPTGAFAGHGIVYDRIEFEAGQLPSEGIEASKKLETSVSEGMIPIVLIQPTGFPKCAWGGHCLPTGTEVKTYVEGFVKTAKAILGTYPTLKAHPSQPILFEAVNEPYGYGSAEEYAGIVHQLLPEALKAGIPLEDLYIAATGKKWVSEMYKAQPALETEVAGWDLHPYGPPSGSLEENSVGIQSVPLVQAEMTSGQNNIVVSEVGYWTPDVNEGKDKGASGTVWAENSVQAAGWLTEMLYNAQTYHQAGWLKALLVFSRNAGGWAMQVPYTFLTAQGSALTSVGDAESGPSASSQFGSSGSEEGKFESPWGVAVDPRNSNVYVSDHSANRVEEFDASGSFLASVGSPGEGQLKAPEALAVDASGDLYVGDGGNHRVVEFNSSREYLRKLGSEGTGNGQFGAAIRGLAVDSSGNVWASDSTANRIEEFTSAGEYHAKFGSGGSGNGEFSDPRGIAVDGGNLYVADYSNHRVQEFTTAGAYVRQWGHFGEGNGELEDPWGIGADQRTGNLYVSDFGSDRMEEFSSTGVFIAWLSEFGSGKGQFNDPEGLATNATGGIYIANPGNHRVDVWASPGPKWLETKPLNPAEASASQLAGISCTTACTAVGSYTSKAGVKEALGEYWEGTEWALQSIAAPKGAKASTLSAVACTAAIACTAVGADTEGTSEVTLAESWNGKAWTVQGTPNPSQAKATVLAGVACPTKACYAVGSTTSKAGVKEVFTAGSDGVKWAQQGAAIPKGAKVSSLGAVSCSAASACTAVGSYTNSSASEVTLAEGWNGKEWVVQVTPNPSQAKASVLAGVACPTKACYAVGSFTSKAGVKESVAERYSGSEWSIQSVLAPNGAKASELTSVSCVSESACTAVGSYTSKAGVKEALALGFNGSLWALQSTVDPSEASGISPAGVSCVWSTGCYDVGSYTNAKGTQVTLGQEYLG
jgi:IPT/TIG domain/NHL repeat